LKIIIPSTELDAVDIVDGSLVIDFNDTAQAAMSLRRTARRLEAGEDMTRTIAAATPEQLAEAIDHCVTDGDS